MKRVLVASLLVLVSAELGRRPADPEWQTFARLDDAPKGTCVVADQSWAARPLPAGEPDAKHSLSLTLDGDRFVIESDGPEMVLWPDWHLVARWWDNGNPVTPPKLDHFIWRQLGRLVRWGKRMTVAFGLPDDLGPVKPGDRLAVQVLYAPAGYDFIVEGPARQMNRPVAGDRASRVPLLSNRLEFTLTAALAARKDHPRNDH